MSLVLALTRSSDAGTLSTTHRWSRSQGCSNVPASSTRAFHRARDRPPPRGGAAMSICRSSGIGCGSRPRVDRAPDGVDRAGLLPDRRQLGGGGRVLHQRERVRVPPDGRQYVLLGRLADVLQVVAVRREGGADQLRRLLPYEGQPVLVPLVLDRRELHLVRDGVAGYVG